MKTLSLVFGLILCCSLYAEETQPPVMDKSDAAGTTIGKTLRDEIKTMKDKALKLKEPIEKVLGIACPEKRLADTLLSLEKHPEKIDLAIEYCSALETIITELRASILSTLETNLTKQQKTVVDGLGQLAVVVDENARKAQAKAQQLTDPEARKRYENLASDYRKIAGAYRIVAKKYAELPLADQVKRLQQQVEYLEDVREFVVHVREVAIPLVGSQNALDRLKEYTVAVGHVQESVSRFASVLSEGVVKFDPQKQVVEIIRQQASPASPASTGVDTNKRPPQPVDTLQRPAELK